MAGSTAPVVAQLVETLRTLAGSHPGFRPAHGKGVVCSGTFRASPDARRVTRAPHLQGQSVPTVVRFSNASGDPGVHDGVPGVRALSVKFQLPDGKTADILANSIEGFPVRTPEEFLEFLRAQLPDPATGKPAPDALPHFLESHPTARAFIERLMKKPVPASYAQASYHAEHAFRFTAADGTSRFGRYRWNPEAGEAYLSRTMRASEARTSARRPREPSPERAGRVSPAPANGRAERSDGQRDGLVAPGSAPDRAGTPGGDRHLADQRGRRTSPGVRSQQPCRRHRSLGRPDSPGAFGRLLHLVRASQQGRVRAARHEAGCGTTQRLAAWPG